MNDIKIFENDEFGKVRTVDKNGKVMFCGSDVAKALGYSKPNNALNQHCKGDTSKQGIIDNLGRTQQAVFINEGDLYRLIANSKLPTAQKFESWVFDEVLPTIRKTGGYVNNDEQFVNTYLPFADDATKSLFKQTLNVINQQNKIIEEQKPKADYYDVLAEKHNNTNLRDTAKEFNIKQNDFVDLLLKGKYIYRDKNKNIKPYARYINDGIFVLKEFAYFGNVGNQTMVTPKGKQLLIHKIAG